MTNLSSSAFDPNVFLAHAGLGRRIVELNEGENFFSQGDLADSVFYIQRGRARVTVVSSSGKEATITLIQWEFPRLCRGGSSSLTFAGVHPRNSER